MLADDGMPVRDAVTLAARPEDLPARADLLARTRKMLDDVLTTRAAKVGDDYSGPVLVEARCRGDAGVAVVRAALPGPAAAGLGPRRARRRAGGTTPFLTRIGNRVLPESFTVKDTPSMTRLGERRRAAPTRWTTRA